MTEKTYRPPEHNLEMQSQESPGIDPDDEPGLSIWPLLLKLWEWRRFILCTGGVSLGLYLCLFLYAQFTYPSQKAAQVSFRLLFDGAEKKQYPNGSPFSPADIISTPILEQVYNDNSLKEYGRFTWFKTAVMVKPLNLKLTFLEEGYRARLSETKLSSIERQRMERQFEFERQSLLSADYMLVFSNLERLREMPASLAEKILVGILDTYARDAVQKRGAMQYLVSIPTRSMIRQDLLEQDDYLVCIDLIRNAIQKVQATIRTLMGIPGAQVLKLPGKDIRLTDVQSNLDDLLRYRISPLLGVLRAIGPTKNAALTIQYLQNQLFTLNLDREAARQRVRVLEDSLRSYVQQRPNYSGETSSSGRTSGTGLGGNIPALIPQLGESFFDRLMELGSRGDDTGYRQGITNRSIEAGMQLVEYEREAKYYEDLMAVFRQPSGRLTPEALQQFQEVFQQKYTLVQKELLTAIDNINLFFDRLSEQNLNPPSLLYQLVTPPYVRSQSTLSQRRILLGTTLYFTGVAFGILAWIFLYDRFQAFRRSPAPKR